MAYSSSPPDMIFWLRIKIPMCAPPILVLWVALSLSGEFPSLDSRPPTIFSFANTQVVHPQTAPLPFSSRCLVILMSDATPMMNMMPIKQSRTIGRVSISVQISKLSFVEFKRYELRFSKEYGSNVSCAVWIFDMMVVLNLWMGGWSWYAFGICL